MSDALQRTPSTSDLKSDDGPERMDVASRAFAAALAQYQRSRRHARRARLGASGGTLVRHGQTSGGQPCSPPQVTLERSSYASAQLAPQARRYAGHQCAAGRQSGAQGGDGQGVRDRARSQRAHHARVAAGAGARVLGRTGDRPCGEVAAARAGGIEQAPGRRRAFASRAGRRQRRGGRAHRRLQRHGEQAAGDHGVAHLHGERGQLHG